MTDNKLDLLTNKYVSMIKTKRQNPIDNLMITKDETIANLENKIKQLEDDKINLIVEYNEKLEYIQLEYKHKLANMHRQYLEKLANK